MSWNDEVLTTWGDLNHALSLLSGTKGERAAAALLSHELLHHCRESFLLRVHSRLNKLRAHRERDELRAVVR